MKRKKYYYKICTNTNESIMARDRWNIKYKLNKWIYPNIKKSKLFIFETLKEARTFYGAATDEIIYKCIVKNPKQGKIVLYSSIYHLNHWNQHWKKSYIVKKNCIGYYTKTTMCDALKLIRKINVN